MPAADGVFQYGSNMLATLIRTVFQPTVVLVLGDTLGHTTVHARARNRTVVSANDWRSDEVSQMEAYMERMQLLIPLSDRYCGDVVPLRATATEAATAIVACQIPPVDVVVFAHTTKKELLHNDVWAMREQWPQAYIIGVSTTSTETDRLLREAVDERKMRVRTELAMSGSLTAWCILAQNEATPLPPKLAQVLSHVVRPTAEAAAPAAPAAVAATLASVESATMA